MATFIIPNEPSEVYVNLVKSEIAGFFKGDAVKAGAAVSQAMAREGYKFGLKDGRAQGFLLGMGLAAGAWGLWKYLKKDKKEKVEE